MDKACVRLGRDKNKGFSIFGQLFGSWWIEQKWPEGFISGRLVYCWHPPVHVSPLTVPRVSSDIVFVEGEVRFWFLRRWSKCLERRLRRCREDAIQREKKKNRKKNNNTKIRNYQNSIQARMWQLRAGQPRTLMMGTWLSICEDDLRWLQCQYRLGQQVSAMPFLHAVHRWSPAGGAQILKSITSGDNEMSQSTALVRWVARPLTSALSKTIHLKGW